MLLVPTGAPNKKVNIWDTVEEAKVNQEEFEELFENKVIPYSNSFRKKKS